MKLKVFLIAGARPNFMKIAPIYEHMRAQPENFTPFIVHTGQHYDKNMSKVFFEDLDMPHPDIYLDVGSGTHAEQTAEIMRRFEPHLLEQKPDLVLVVGDVNSTLACALTTVKSQVNSPRLSKFWQCYENYLQNRNIKGKPNQRIRSHKSPIIAHVEAGERSFDFSMPEEINRVETDIVSDMLFTTCSDSDENLLSGGIEPRIIFRVGNIMIDSLQKYLKKSAASNILMKLNAEHLPEHFPQIREKGFALVTLHRPGNVDDPATLMAILYALKRISEDLPIVFPMHPRTRKLTSSLDTDFVKEISHSKILICEPFGYLDFLQLQTEARLVFTDSGGVQVETSYLGVPCLTIRPNTEWQITIREGTNRLVSPVENEIVTAANSALAIDKRRPAKIKNWDGQTASRIIKVLTEMFQLSN